MAAKRTSISRQQRRAERKHRKGLPEQTPIYRRETLDDVLAELDYEHIALGLEPESSSRDSKMLETSETVELAVKTEASAEENPLAASVYFMTICTLAIYRKNCKRFWIT